MSISDTRNAQKYASIAEAAAAQAKISATELENAPQYAQQAAASATASASSAQAAISAEATVQSLSNSASQSASQAAISASEASSAADSAIGRTIRAPEGEQLSALPSASDRASKVPLFSGDGSLEVKALAEFAVLDSTGKIPVSVIPAIALTEPFVANSQAAMLALDAQMGDICKRTDLGYSFCLASSPASTLANWIQLTDDVLAQLGQKTGAAQVGAADEDNNPTTVQTALNSKVSSSTLSQANGAALVGFGSGNVSVALTSLDGRIDVVEAFDAQLLSASGAKSVGVESDYQLSDWYSDETAGHVSVLKFIPKNLHQYLTNYTQSQNNAGDLITYFNQASTYCESNHKDLRVPFGYYFISDTFMLPAACSVIGEGYPYLLATSTFSSNNIMVSCDKTGQPTYNMHGFNINGNSNINLTGLRIGGCRNSSFRAIVVTNCPAAAVDVYPTVTTSGDVENLELNHVWSVLSGGLLMRCNASISRGNITDAEVVNCQLTTGDATTVGTPAIRMNGAAGKELFGVKFDRVFTKTTDNDHIVINPNGGKVYHNVFSHMSGESWTVAAGGISNSFSKNALFVFDGEFTANTFRDFYGQGVPGNGITLGVGSSGNVFDSLRFLDKNIVGFNNVWLRIPAGAIANNFTSIYFDQSFNRANTGYGAVAANYIFRASDGKIIDLSGSTRFDSEEMRSIAPTLVKRTNIFAITSGQLTNYPVSGCSFSSTANGVSIAVPSGSTAYFLTIPFTPTAGFAGKFVGFTVRYVCGAMNGMTLSADICGSGSSMTDLTQNKVNVFSAYGAYNSSNKTVTITFGGTRTAQANLELQDIIITEGACIPYMPNFSKLYLES